MPAVILSELHGVVIWLSQKDGNMSIKQYYEEKKADYNRLRELLDNRDINDYCGAWCNNDVLTSMLENPTKKNAAYYYSELITIYATAGMESKRSQSNMPEPIDIHDPEIYEILKRNGDVG